MAGNEQKIIQFLIENKHKVSLNHLGIISSIQNPTSNGMLDEILNIKNVKTESALKKADIYINGKGVSLKQNGEVFLFNRLQRSSLIDFLQSIRLNNHIKFIEMIDSLVKEYHLGILKDREVPWKEIFKESDFISMSKYLLMLGSPIKGDSKYPAEFILTAPKNHMNSENISCVTFEEYFDTYKDKMYFSIRRQWVGQNSKTEHRRALGMLKKPENNKWVFDNVSGEPNSGWRTDWVEKDRKTVYMLYLSKLK